MARIELRDATIYFRDGLSGTSQINEPTPIATDTDLTIGTTVLNTADTTLVPVGSRFTVAGETIPTTLHTVTARTPTGSGPTTNIVFSPALGPGTYASGGILTFQPQQVEVKVGEGNVTWTVNKEYEYTLDRGNLDTVREGDQQPMDVSLDLVYEFITTGTGESITPYDAVNGIGGASEWVSSSTDPCEPYAVDVVIEHVPPCGGLEPETTTLPDYRYETFEADLEAATISSGGRCNTVLPTVVRITP